MAVIHVTDRKGNLHTVEAKPGASLMEILRERGLDVEAICGGCCSCATCHVFIDDDWAVKLKPRSEDELELVQSTASYRPSGSRLSCQVPFTPELDGLRLTVAPEE